MSGDSLFVARWGDGPDVVFLHGLMASSRYWEPLAAATSGYRATAPDLLGFGRSPSPPEASYDVDCYSLISELPAASATGRIRVRDVTTFRKAFGPPAALIMPGTAA